MTKIAIMLVAVAALTGYFLMNPNSVQASYDLIPLFNQVQNHEKRMKDAESQVIELTKQLQQAQADIQALQDKSSVAPVTNVKYVLPTAAPSVQAPPAPTEPIPTPSDSPVPYQGGINDYK